MASRSSVLSCELVDAALLAARIGADWTCVARAFEECCADVVERFGGRIVSGPGGGLRAGFGAPAAGADGAEPAVRAALALVEALDALNPQLEKDQRVWLEIRVGVDTGPLAAEARDTPTDRLDPEAVARATRLSERAPPGSILICEATWRRVEGRFVTTPLRASDAPPAWLVRGAVDPAKGADEEEPG